MPDTDREIWNQALWGEDHALLQKLINQEAPPVVLMQLELYIRQLYMMLAKLDPVAFKIQYPYDRIVQISGVLQPLRSLLGGWIGQRVHDIQMMRLIRKSGALSVVVGAGATIAAGGPSWPDLVHQLLTVAVNEGRKIYKYEKTTTEFSVEQKAKLVDTVQLKPGKEKKARDILKKIDAGSTDTELLMEGAQLCADLFQESLFQQITMILYPEGNREPSEIHYAIAKMAKTQDAYQIGLCPGWVAVINYNFDSLMNDALEEENIKYKFSMMRNGTVQQYSKRDDSQHHEILPVVHLHGFTPRQPFFDINGIDYVFSTKQYESFYNREEPTIINYAMNKYISNPAYVALYVGCSFTDQKMNMLLQEAISQYPSRHHYALLALPEKLKGDDDQDALEKENLKYQKMGIQPIWFYDYSEIPDIICRLA